MPTSAAAGAEDGPGLAPKPGQLPGDATKTVASTKPVNTDATGLPNFLQTSTNKKDPTNVAKGTTISK